MRAAVGRILSVDEGMVLLAETVRMRKDDLQRLRLQVERRVELLELRLVRNKVGKALVGANGLSVQIDRETRIDVAVHLHAAQHVLFAHFEVLQDLRIGLIMNESTVRLAFLALTAFLGLQTAFLEVGLGVLPVTKRAHFEELGERIDGLRTDTVHTSRELVVLIVVLAAGVHLRNAVHDFLERDAAAVVADTHLTRVIIHRNINFLTKTLPKFIDSIIDDFLHQDIDAVMVHRARTGLTDIHARAHTDMRYRIEGLDTICAVIIFRHLLLFQIYSNRLYQNVVANGITDTIYGKNSPNGNFWPITHPIIRSDQVTAPTQSLWGQTPQSLGTDPKPSGDRPQKSLACE